MNLFPDIEVASATIEELVECLTPIFKGLTLKAPIIKAGTKFYRARVINRLPIKISEVGVPPSHIITSHGRLNEKGQAIGYFSSSRRSSYFEICPTAGDYVVLSRWVADTDLMLLHVGYESDVFTYLESSRAVDEVEWPNNARGADEMQRKIYNSLSRELTKVVDYGYEWKYKTTIAIGRKFLSGPQDGLLYPAIAMNGNADNLALKISSLSKLRCTAIEFNCITDIEGTNINLRQIDSAVTWDNSGNLAWNGRPLHWNLSPGQDAIAKVEDGEWVIYDPRGNELSPG